MRRLPLAAVLCALVIVPMARAQSPLPPGTWRVPDAPAEMQYSISRADLIVVSMHDALLRELTEAIRAGGPAFAIKSCPSTSRDHSADRSAEGCGGRQTAIGCATRPIAAALGGALVAANGERATGAPVCRRSGDTVGLSALFAIADGDSAWSRTVRAVSARGYSSAVSRDGDGLPRRDSGWFGWKGRRCAVATRCHSNLLR